MRLMLVLPLLMVLAGGSDPDPPVKCYSDMPEMCPTPKVKHHKVEPHTWGPIKPLGPRDASKRDFDPENDRCRQWMFFGTNVCQKET